MKAFFDSSAFAKRFIDEEGSESVWALCTETDLLGLSVLCVPEIVSALNRRRRERTITPSHYRHAKASLLADVGDAEIVQLTPRVVSSAVRILEEQPLRTLDALPVACAVAWDAGLFVTADRRQARAARSAGLLTRAV